jgi:hypothetical protein
MRSSADHERDRCPERPEAGCSHQEAVARGVAVENIRGERWDQHGEVHADRRDQADHGDRQEHDRCGAHEPQALGQVDEDLADRSRSRHEPGQSQLAVAHQRQADDDGKEARGIDRKRGRDPEHADRQPGDRRSDDARTVEHRGVERYCVPDIAPPDHLVGE